MRLRPEGIISAHYDNLKLVLRAFQYRNYRLFFAGQAVSLIGTWMQVVAVSWLVYRMTNSAFLLGLVGFVGYIPTFLLTPFAGVLADRFNRRRILIVTQTLAMIQASILAALSLTGLVEVWHLIALSMLLGLINAFDIPARQAFVVEMIDEKADLGNAIALSSFVFNSARLIGPSLAGILIAIVGEGICFLINAVTFLAVIFALLAMRLKPGSIQSDTRVFEELKEGFIYTFNFRPMRHILLLTILTSIMGMSYVIVMPIFARDILHGGAHTLGFLMGSAGLGALFGAVYLAAKKDTRGLEKVISRGTLVLGLGLISFSFSTHLWLSLILIMCAGFGMMVQTVAGNTILQTITDDNKRGRVMSFYAMAFMGMMPFGSLLAGIVAGRIGAPYALLISGLACVLGGIIFSKKIASLKLS